jgi:DNA-binding response OmpR family regulator
MGVGTQFLITLPVDEQDWQMHLALQPTDVKNIEPDESGQLPQLHTPVTQNTEKELVLVVDDNLDMQEYLRLLLQDNYEVITAANGKEGIEKANEEIPDLIISDLMMPLMDGYEFSRRIKNQLTSSHVPIILLTAKDTKESKLEGFEIGIDHFLAKPFDADELKLIVRKSIDNRKRLKVLFGKETPNSVTTAPQANPLEARFVKILNGLLEERYIDSQLTVGEIAVAMSLSDTQLRRKLNALGELPPIEYLRRFRLQKAAGLLKNSSATVSEVAFQVGFENLSYFSKVFNQEYGHLPSEHASASIDGNAI